MVWISCLNMVLLFTDNGTPIIAVSGKYTIKPERIREYFYPAIRDILYSIHLCFLLNT